MANNLQSTLPLLALFLQMGLFNSPVCLADDYQPNTNFFGLDSFTYFVTTSPDPQPDLVVIGVEPDKTRLANGDLLGIGATIRNLGEATAGASSVRFYLSKSQYITSSDHLLGSSGSPSLVPGESHAAYHEAAATAEPGEYYIGVCVDQVVDEVDIHNNCETGIPITIEPADTYPCTGQPIHCQQTLSNSRGSTDYSSGPFGSAHYAERYTHYASPGDVLILEAHRSFDGYLLLEDPDGLIVAQNDNYTGASDSRIEHSATKSGTYAIWASSYVPSTTGSFEPPLKCIDNADNPKCTLILSWKDLPELAIIWVQKGDGEIKRFVCVRDTGSKEVPWITKGFQYTFTLAKAQHCQETEMGEVIDSLSFTIEQDDFEPHPPVDWANLKFSPLYEPECINTSRLAQQYAPIPAHETWVHVRHMGDVGTPEWENQVGTPITWDPSVFTGYKPIELDQYLGMFQRGFESDSQSPKNVYQIDCTKFGYLINTFAFSHDYPVECPDGFPECKGGPNIAYWRNFDPPLQVWNNESSMLTLQTYMKLPWVHYQEYGAVGQVVLWVAAKNIHTDQNFWILVGLFDSRDLVDRESILHDGIASFTSSSLAGRAEKKYMLRSPYSHTPQYRTSWGDEEKFMRAHVSWFNMKNILADMKLPGIPSDYRITSGGILLEVSPPRQYDTLNHGRFEISVGGSFHDFSIYEAYKE